MFKPLKTYTTIQDFEEGLANQREAIQRARGMIECMRHEIRTRIQAGQSSGNPIHDIVYQMGSDPTESATFVQSLEIFRQTLEAHADEFMIVEETDIIETYHGGPDDTTSLPIDQNSYIVGIISPPGINPFMVVTEGEKHQFKSVFLNLLHAKAIEFSIPLLAQLQGCGDSANAIFAQRDGYEPDAVTYLSNKRIRFWIGNNRVALCLHHLVIRDVGRARELRKTILDIMDILVESLPNSTRLSEELMDRDGFYGESKSTTHTATS